MITKDYVAEVVKHCLVLSSQNDIFVDIAPHVKVVSLRAYVGGWKVPEKATETVEFYYGEKTDLNQVTEKAIKKRIEKFIEKYAK